MICFKTDVWCRMNGILIVFRDVTEGSVHDSRLFQTGRCADGTREHRLDHAKGEYWLADSGAHCLVSFTHAARHEELPEAEQKALHTHHARIQSHIEQLFAVVDVFRCVARAVACIQTAQRVTVMAATREQPLAYVSKPNTSENTAKSARTV